MSPVPDSGGDAPPAIPDDPSVRPQLQKLLEEESTIVLSALIAETDYSAYNEALGDPLIVSDLLATPAFDSLERGDIYFSVQRNLKLRAVTEATTHGSGEEGTNAMDEVYDRTAVQTFYVDFDDLSDDHRKLIEPQVLNNAEIPAWSKTIPLPDGRICVRVFIDIDRVKANFSDKAERWTPKTQILSGTLWGVHVHEVVSHTQAEALQGVTSESAKGSGYVHTQTSAMEQRWFGWQ
ncbi:hypothetical protein L6R49_19200 [Myxococcota bacterium]|nr:hypothetical protein [Myxococcota bacterium]